MTEEICEKCSGEGWLWGYELDEYEMPEGCIWDDNRYPCDACGKKQDD